MDIGNEKKHIVDIITYRCYQDVRRHPWARLSDLFVRRIGTYKIIPKTKLFLLSPLFRLV
ncbi:hypothetical protein BpHYR1_013688 [Brachionus plicatilis]|uniref:Uncharacterized protein n=1 Tax=Brachionus plicatilis TaxID=10195 RepID=A0A3M7RTP2_BRAPC|nr:hypothetical protein BpHYR1_013688 [Brachionus plicatilis]